MKKPHSCCEGCPRKQGDTVYPYHYVEAPVPSDATLIIVTEAPISSKNNKYPDLYKDDGGAIIRTAVEVLRREKNYRDLNVAFTYAVRCTSNQGDTEPPKSVLQQCKTLLQSDLQLAARSPVILAMGMGAVRALDIKAAKLKDIQGRLLPKQTVGNVLSGERKFDVVVSISAKQLVAVPGLYTTFIADLRKAADAALTGGFDKVPTIEELTQGYQIPKTVEDVKRLCRYIIDYTEADIRAENWPISTDTETNTKFPHRDKLRVLAVSFAWAEGKAAAIPMWHPETPYDPEEVVPYIREVLASQKPKFLHNLKFDFKVFLKMGWLLENIAWDSMLGEHALEEDKKGQYGLKPLTRTNFPDFAAYADALHELLTKAEGESQLENIRKAIKEAEVRASGDAAAQKRAKKKEEVDGGFEKIPLATLLLYAAVDSDMTRRLVVLQEARIRAEQAETVRQLVLEGRNITRKYPIPHLCKTELPVRTLLRKHVLPVTPVLARMEFGGVRIDRPYLTQLQTDLGAVIEKTTAELYSMARGEMKLNSPADIVRVLFSDGFTHPGTGANTIYPVDGVSKTKKGALQTTEKVMQALVAMHACPFATKKLIYAKAFKAKNTFCENVGALSELDGYLHTNYNQHGTNSGRLSSNDENMQNIPKKLAKVNIKKVFITDDDSYLFVNADAKGAEVRILTAYCQDAALIASLNAGQDTHCFIASKIIELVRESPGAKETLASMNLDDAYPLTYEDFSTRERIKDRDKAYGEMLDKFRTAVKRVVFGILYGAGPQKIAETIGISLSQAQRLIDMLFLMFPSIKGYMDQTRWELSRFGYVETFFGRRRRFSVAGGPRYLLGRAERQTVNFKIQSTSSEIVMGRLVACEDPLRDMGGRLLLTVHDSIGFQIKKKYASQLPAFVKEVLEDGAAVACPWLPVAFNWDYEVGPSYGELKSLESYLANTTELEYSNDAAEAFTEEDVRSTLAEG